jgi:undecaprenyl diphosphate synthase
VGDARTLAQQQVSVLRFPFSLNGASCRLKTVLSNLSQSIDGRELQPAVIQDVELPQVKPTTTNELFNMMSDLPQIIGWELAEAEQLLSAAGQRVVVRATAPPRGPVAGTMRVVRQRVLEDGSIELVVAAHSQGPVTTPNTQVTIEEPTMTGSSLSTENTHVDVTPLSEDDLIARIDPTRVPQHVAIVMDGNGRWAERQGLPRVMGHRAGHESVTEVVRVAPDFGVRHLTLYTFSAENWRRPETEVSALMELIPAVLRYELPYLKEQGVMVRPIGRVDGLPQHVQDQFHEAYEETKHNTRLTLNIAVNYSGRWEIVDAARRIAERVKQGEIEPDQIDEALFASMLYQPDTPDPELLIRTSGEHRISNYLLWQIAYTEVYVTPVLWPDFRRIHLVEAILDYQQRRRRFGAIADSPTG